MSYHCKDLFKDISYKYTFKSVDDVSPTVFSWSNPVASVCLFTEETSGQTEYIRNQQEKTRKKGHFYIEMKYIRKPNLLLYIHHV